MNLKKNSPRSIHLSHRKSCGAKVLSCILKTNISQQGYHPLDYYSIWPQMQDAVVGRQNFTGQHWDSGAWYGASKCKSSTRALFFLILDILNTGIKMLEGGRGKQGCLWHASFWLQREMYMLLNAMKGLMYDKRKEIVVVCRSWHMKNNRRGTNLRNQCDLCSVVNVI